MKQSETRSGVRRGRTVEGAATQLRTMTPGETESDGIFVKVDCSVEELDGEDDDGEEEETVAHLCLAKISTW